MLKSSTFSFAVGLLLWLVLPTMAFAQSTLAGAPGPRIELDAEHEIALARSAAPPDVSGEATVLVFNGTRWETSIVGSNGVTCWVARTWPESLEPHCFDEEGTRTILPIHIAMAEAFVEGRTLEQVERMVADGIASGQFRLPSRPVVSYMMSADQVLVSETGDLVGSWEPHLMIYQPYLTQSDIGGSGENLDGVLVSDPGSPLANIVIVMKTAVEADRRERSGG